MEQIKKVQLPMSELSKLLELRLGGDGSAVLTVTGSSMVPMLYNWKDQVWLKKMHRDPKRGDLILYCRANGQYVLHRVVQSEDLVGCICCGDNCCESELVNRSAILAVVFAFTHKGRYYTVENRIYRLYAWIWTELMPFRKPILRLRRCLGRWRRNWRNRSIP